MNLNLKKDEKTTNSKTNIYNFIKENFMTISICLFFFMLVVYLFQITVRKSNLILSCFAAILPIFFFLFFKSLLDEKKRKVPFTLFKIELFFTVSILLNDILLSLFKSLNGVFDFSFFIYIVNFGVLLVLVALGAGNGLTEFFEKINDMNLLKDISETEQIKPGDAVIGYKVDLKTGEKTKEPVILPLKDRFLHMLILGPTGCGKTSQSIIPMINRDMSNPDAGITVLEPKGDLAEKIYAMANYYGREVLYFNPILKDCPFFNPLEGDETDVIENMATTFNMLNPDSPQFFKDMTDGLIRKSVKLLKRCYGDDATLIDLNTLLWNTNNEGTAIVKDFKQNHSDPNPTIQKENDELIYWFLNDYYAGIGGGKGAPKTYENCSGVRTQVSKLISNKYLRKVLNPPKSGTPEYYDCKDRPRINFDDAFERGIVVTMSTAQGALRELGKYLGYFIILQLQASVFRRPGNENTRKHNMLFIDEFQVYSNPGFADMLTMGRSYRVACHLATQARAQIGMGSGRDGDSFVKLVSTNARNKIIYPGVSAEDAKYYSDEFGEILKLKVSKSVANQKFFASIFEARETVKKDEELEARFSPTDIIYKPFGQITYCLVKNNSVAEPGVSQIQYIDKDLNDLLDDMVAKFNEEQIETKKDNRNIVQTNNINSSNINTSDIIISKPEPIMEDLGFDIPDPELEIDSIETKSAIEPEIATIDEDIELDLDDM